MADRRCQRRNAFCLATVAVFIAVWSVIQLLSVSQLGT